MGRRRGRGVVGLGEARGQRGSVIWISVGSELPCHAGLAW